MKYQNKLTTTLSLLLVAGTIGCGAASLPETAVTPTPPPPVKAILMDVANSGELGSTASTLRENLEAMKATDSAKAESLLNELTELEALEDPDEIKAKASAMAEQL